PAEWAEQNVLFIRFSVTIRILKKPDIWNAPGDHPIFVRVNANRDIQPVNKCRHLLRAAIRIKVFEYFNGIARWLLDRGGKRILARTRHPEPSPGIERQIHWFINVRFRRDQLNLETVGQAE